MLHWRAIDWFIGGMTDHACMHWGIFKFFCIFRFLGSILALRWEKRAFLEKEPICFVYKTRRRADVALCLLLCFDLYSEASCSYRFTCVCTLTCHAVNLCKTCCEHQRFKKDWCDDEMLALVNLVSCQDIYSCMCCPKVQSLPIPTTVLLMLLSSFASAPTPTLNRFLSYLQCCSKTQVCVHVCTYNELMRMLGSLLSMYVSGLLTTARRDTNNPYIERAYSVRRAHGWSMPFT